MSLKSVYAHFLNPIGLSAYIYTLYCSVQNQQSQYLVVLHVLLPTSGLHHEIDIWKSVQSVRTQRPGIIQTEVGRLL